MEAVHRHRKQGGGCRDDFAKHGAKPGMRFAVVEEGEPVRLDGKILGRRKKTVGVISIDGVEEGFSSARVVEGSGFQSGQKLVEQTA